MQGFLTGPLDHAVRTGNDGPHAGNGDRAARQRHEIDHAEPRYRLGRFLKARRGLCHLVPKLGGKGEIGLRVTCENLGVRLRPHLGRAHHLVLRVEHEHLVMAEILAHPVHEVLGQPCLIAHPHRRDRIVPDGRRVLLDHDPIHGFLEPGRSEPLLPLQAFGVNLAAGPQPDTDRAHERQPDDRDDAEHEPACKHVWKMQGHNGLRSAPTLAARC